MQAFRVDLPLLVTSMEISSNSTRYVGIRPIFNVFCHQILFVRPKFSKESLKTSHACISSGFAASSKFYGNHQQFLEKCRHWNEPLSLILNRTFFEAQEAHRDLNFCVLWVEKGALRHQNTGKERSSSHTKLSATQNFRKFSKEKSVEFLFLQKEAIRHQNTGKERSSSHTKLSAT
jgi:hypothetical protein